MNGRPINTLCQILLLLALVTPTALRATDTGDLFAAAREGDIERLRQLGTDGVNRRDGEQRTALMHAAAAASFGALRELLWLGADATLTAADGLTALQRVNGSAGDALACQLLLRAYAFMKANGRPPAGPPARPQLVLLFEPMVNYLHPKIRPFYYVNDAELQGGPGVDDDHNGFIDDVYGWNLDADRAHEINQLQFQIYLESRETIAQLFSAHNDYELGRLSEAEYRELRSGFDNPLAQIFGRNSGFTNGDFLDRALELSHGSHVAGIVIEHSRREALLHTLSWEAFGNYKEFVAHRPVMELARAAQDVMDFLARFRAETLAEMLAEGRRLSDYVRATGAGVVNVSMGIDVARAADSAQRLAVAYLQASGTRLTPPQMDALRQVLPDLAFECYIANAVQFVVPMFENPDVLFVVAAGNRDDPDRDAGDNDRSFQAPAYLARFLPNVITVAAVDGRNEFASFSHFGRLSVDLAAPGVQIRSTVIPEASVVLDGTSMAAPAVAGAAAYLRRRRPDLSASDLKKIIQFTAKPSPSLRDRVGTGGALDEDELLKVASADPAIRAGAYAAAARAAAAADAQAFPDRAVSAQWLNREAVVGWTQAIAALNKDAPTAERAGLFVARAQQHLALAERAAAHVDALLARQIDAAVPLPDELRRLLP